MQKVFFLLKERFQQVRRYHKIVLGITLILLVVITFLTVFLQHGKGELQEQLMAVRWSDDNDVAQLSCFYAVSAGVTEFDVEGLRHGIEQSLREQAIEPNTKNARLYVDAYSAEGNITIQSAKKTIDVNAIGVGGEFFWFHPVELLSGMYFSGDALMQDSVILDEEAAWQLFGSNDIVDQQVTIGGVPFRVAGVYKRPQGDLETMAGSKNTTVYISYAALASLTGESITCYEIVMPNPVKGFAMNIFTEKNATWENNVNIIENSDRFSYEALYKIWKERAFRSMKTDDIVYPFWENLARVQEEKMTEIAFWQCILLVSVVLYWGVAFLVFIIRHKPTVDTLRRIGDYFRELWRWMLKKIKKKKTTKEKNIHIREQKCVKEE